MQLQSKCMNVCDCDKVIMRINIGPLSYSVALCLVRVHGKISNCIFIFKKEYELTTSKTLDITSLRFISKIKFI